MRGRRVECENIDQLLAGAREGRSAVVVVRGEAGIGKTALLDHGRDAASGFRAVHTVGFEAEIGFAFAGLQQLCAPLLEHLDALPEPQQIALEVGLGRRTGDQPDPFLVGLAILSVLAEAAEERPLLCLVDDVQWLDTVSVQALAFVARRLHAERIALLFGLRDPDGDDGAARLLAGLPELRLAGLDDRDARAVLTTAVHTRLDDGVRERIVAEARGNPLALLELARYASPAGLAGGFGLPDALSAPERIEKSFRRRSATLPAATQLLLLVAAAEPVGDPALFWRAADQLGLGPEDAEPACAAEILEIGARVRFSHPLARSAVYRAAAPADRRRAHRAIAAVTDTRTDPDRSAWHHAQAVLGTDDAAAAELELVAGRARARGGLAAAAAFLQRSAALTPEPATRARRMLDAASVQHQAGASGAALESLAAATDGPLDELQQARAQLLRAQVAFHTTRGTDVPGMLLDAAKKLAPLDAALSRETYLQAIEASMLAGPLAHRHGIVEVAEAARAAPAPLTPPRPLDQLLDGLVTHALHGYEASVPGLRRTLDSFLRLDTSDDDLRRLWLACHTAMALWDETTMYSLAERGVRLAREAGLLATLPFALNFLAAVLVHTGQLGRVAELVDESDAIARSTGSAPIPHGRLILAAWQGNRDEATALHAASVDDSIRRGEGTGTTISDYALAVLHNGLGDHEAALAAAERVRDSDEMVHAAMALPELVEAAVRAGRPEAAGAALEVLAAQARVTSSPWALGLEARSRGLTGTGPAVEELHRAAVEHLADSRMTAHLARARLVYGEWLRREGRRREAREQLRTAYTLLSGMGADGFAKRAASELRATGEYVRERTAESTDALTAQELRIARLVATGATSKEAGAQLFLSPRTIDAHLRSIFRKLGITARRQLRDLNLG